MLGKNYFDVYYSMGLDSNFTSEEIQRIKTDANNADTQDLDALANAPQGQTLKNTRKRKFRKSYDLRGVVAFQKRSSSN